MQTQQKRLLLLNALGGAAVLASYAWGFLARPDSMSALWGGVPESARGFYTLNMFLAAGGYFLFTPHILLRLRALASGLGPALEARLFPALYLAILVPSALWLPLTAAMVESPSAPLWWLIRLDLALVGLGSLGLLAAIWLVRDPAPPRGRVLASVGLLPFCLQTAVLDALVWPAYFAAPG